VRSSGRSGVLEISLLDKQMHTTYHLFRLLLGGRASFWEVVLPKGSDAIDDRSSLTRRRWLMLSGGLYPITTGVDSSHGIPLLPGRTSHQSCRLRESAFWRRTPFPLAFSVSYGASRFLRHHHYRDFDGITPKSRRRFTTCGKTSVSTSVYP
jgi:hypothetical protein